MLSFLSQQHTPEFVTYREKGFALAGSVHGGLALGFGPVIAHGGREVWQSKTAPLRAVMQTYTQNQEEEALKPPGTRRPPARPHLFLFLPPPSSACLRTEPFSVGQTKVEMYRNPTSKVGVASKRPGRRGMGLSLCDFAQGRRLGQHGAVEGALPVPVLRALLGGRARPSHTHRRVCPGTVLPERCHLPG